MQLRNALFSIALVIAVASVTHAANYMLGMQQGTPDIKSAGPATFAPSGILLIGDTQGAAVFAIATGDKADSKSAHISAVENVDQKVAVLLGATPAEILINDMAVNPETGNVYLTVSRGRGPDAKPAIVRIDASGKVEELPLDDVMYSKAAIPDAATGEKQRQEVTTDLQFVDGNVIVAGLSNEEFSSQLRVIPLPFTAVEKGASVEIYHGSHGKFETKSPVRTLAVCDVGGKPTVLAAYTCTPLVKFPLGELKPGAKIKGTTVAELGNHNRPLDMVVYDKGGKSYVLMANNSRGVMKVDLTGIDQAAGITDRVRDTAGLSYETIASLQNVSQLDRLDKEHAVVLIQPAGGGLNLQAVDLP